jgi:hypothetical protein
MNACWPPRACSEPPGPHARGVRRCQGAKVRRCQSAKVPRCESATLRECEGFDSVDLRACARISFNSAGWHGQLAAGLSVGKTKNTIFLKYNRERLCVCAHSHLGTFALWHFRTCALSHGQAIRLLVRATPGRLARVRSRWARVRSRLACRNGGMWRIAFHVLRFGGPASGEMIYKNRKRKIAHSAAKPSRQVIFLPSA